MRVIAGKLGGQIFDSPKGHRTHPMSEKIRGGLFGALGDINGLRVLDAFSGSGALAIEAISRGAEFVQTIEVDPRAHKVIEKNLKNLGISDKVKATKAYVNAWSTRHINEKFNIILADPPYDEIPFRDLKGLPNHLDEGGVLVLSWPSNYDDFHFDELKIIKNKNYGDGKLLFYK